MKSFKSKYSQHTYYEIFLREKMRFSAAFRLIRKYEPPRYFYDVKIINDLIFNEETHLVVLFREYCTLENSNEYLRRFYFKEEIKHKIPKILNFYDKYSKIYPNYTSLPESKYMYKNIKRKQKMIDNIQDQEEANKHKHQRFNNTSDTISHSNIFNSRVRHSISSQTITLFPRETYTNNDNNNNNHTQSSSASYSVVNLLSTIDKIDKDMCDKHKASLINKTSAHVNIMNPNANKQQVIMSSLGKYKSLQYTHFFSKKNNYNKKTISASSSTNTTTTNKKTSVLIQANSKPKIVSNKINLQNPTRRNKNSNDFKNVMYNRFQSGNKSSGSKGKSSYTNTLIPAKSSNVSHSKTERIVSSPGNSNLKSNLSSRLNIKNIKKHNHFNRIDNSNNNNHKSKKANHNNNNTNSKSNINNNRNNKIKSSDLSNRNLYSFLNNFNISHTKIKRKPKSKSPKSNAVLTIKTRKTSPNNNSVIISTLSAERKASTGNININNNNIQQQSNQINNIYNNNNNSNNTSNNGLLLRSMHLHSGSILHSSIIRQKISQQQKQIKSQNNSNRQSPSSHSHISSLSNGSSASSSKSKQKFELNIKKLIDKKLFESTESRTERYVTNSSKNSLLGSHNSNYYNSSRKISNFNNEDVSIESKKSNMKAKTDLNKITVLFKSKVNSLYNLNNLIVKQNMNDNDNSNNNNKLFGNSVIDNNEPKFKPDRLKKNKITFK